MEIINTVVRLLIEFATNQIVITSIFTLVGVCIGLLFSERQLKRNLDYQDRVRKEDNLISFLKKLDSFIFEAQISLQHAEAINSIDKAREVTNDFKLASRGINEFLVLAEVYGNSKIINITHNIFDGISKIQNQIDKEYENTGKFKVDLGNVLNNRANLTHEVRKILGMAAL